jgi:hypothetical protein
MNKLKIERASELVKGYDIFFHRGGKIVKSFSFFNVSLAGCIYLGWISFAEYLGLSPDNFSELDCYIVGYSRVLKEVIQ